MKRKISGFHRDKVGDWVADLDCGHTLHMRHQPPWRNRAWVTSAAGRQNAIGKEIDCPKCTQITSAGETAMNENPIYEQQRRVAEAIKAACLQAAIEAYEYGKMKGMCESGAWDLAVDAVKTLDVDAVLDTLPE